MTPLQTVQFLDKYARWDDQWQRRETWPETCARVMAFFRHHPPFAAVPETIWSQLEAGLRSMEALPSMRIVQMAGPPLMRCHVGAYNCAYLPLDSWRAFSELLYILMQGTGVGFSVESMYVDQLPTIAPHRVGEAPIHHEIVDTTEGWCEALEEALVCTSQGYDVEFDYAAIRPYGAPLKVKGGRASGPEPLRHLLTTVARKIRAQAGRKLTSLDCHDIACLCGSIVQVGGVRRAAEISLSDFGDPLLRDAKNGQFWLIHPERAMANNSAVYTTKPSMADFMEEWTNLMRAGTGERGIFNREAAMETMPERRLRYPGMGTNPCGEIVLRPRQFCNLSIAVAREDDDGVTLSRKVKLAAIWGTLQSMLTNFHFIRDEWRKNCEEERLLGVDITGIQDCRALMFDNPRRAAMLAHLREVAINVNKEMAALLGIEESAAVTCIKPSGNSSQLLDCSSGLHPRYARYYIRRLRLGAGSPVAALLREAGVTNHPEVGQDPLSPSVRVFDFPIASPKDALTRHDMDAIAQLENWLDLKRFYTEHNPSCTIYVEEDEWLAVGAWVWEHWDEVGGLAFLPKDGGIYELAPYEEITKEEYERLAAAFPVIDFDRLDMYEYGDTTELNREFACTGDRCEL